MSLPILQEQGGALSGLVRGAGAGMQQALPSIAEMILNKQKQKQMTEAFPNLFGISQKNQKPPSYENLTSQQQEDIGSKFGDLALKLEQETGRELSSEDLNNIWKQLQIPASQQDQTGQISPKYTMEDATKAALMGHHDLAQTILKGVEIDQKQKAQQQKQEFQREMKGEEALQEKESKLSSLEDSSMRYERLGELFSPEKDIKFPPSLMVGMFTKDGELNPVAYSQLSPEAQETLKLLADDLSGAKEMFGARVTNFDVQSYQKRLPQLLNSAEGRRQVLRDLRLLNKINMEAEKGVLDIVDKHGGTGKMPLSKAMRLYKQENADQIKQWRSEFVRGENHQFHGLSEADPSIYKGRTIRNSKGERFKSNGKEWLPVEK